MLPDGPPQYSLALVGARRRTVAWTMICLAQPCARRNTLTLVMVRLRAADTALGRNCGIKEPGAMREGVAPGARVLGGPYASAANVDSAAHADK
jgi:hypothetical protein